MKRFLMAGLLLFLLGQVHATPIAETGSFQACVQALQDHALAEGISRPLVENQLASVRFDRRIIGYDRAQPEFTQTFSGYYYQRVNEDRITQGRELYDRHWDLLRQVTRETGVPGRYLVAFWGMETHFGSYFGKLPVLDSLATLACDERRSKFFAAELIAALKILDRGDIQPENLRGSWAGALGHMQFLPSVYLRYAQDADNDGRRDLWGSVPDALTSAGYFLAGLGWNPGERWGREVRLPEGFDYTLAGLSNRRPLDFWRRQGVVTRFGGPLPKADMEAALLVPAGHKGPAFLVYPNFDVIMKWNQSEFYALSVGILADRIVGAPPLYQPPPRDLPSFTRDRIRQLQDRLAELGHEPGPRDGILGPATRGAIRAYQKTRGWIADGFPHPEVLESLGITGAE